MVSENESSELWRDTVDNFTLTKKDFEILATKKKGLLTYT